MANAYTIPDTPGANMTPGQQGVKFVPINRMVPRSFITNVKARATAPAGKPLALRGIPRGPGSDLADSNCRRCHTTEMVLFQPALTHAAWEAEVNKMRNVYKALIHPKDVGAIVDYLTSIKGTR